MNNENKGISSEDILKAAAFFDDDDDAEQVTPISETREIVEKTVSEKIGLNDLKSVADCFDDDDDAPVETYLDPINPPPVKESDVTSKKTQIVDVPVDNPSDRDEPEIGGKTEVSVTDSPKDDEPDIAGGNKGFDGKKIVAAIRKVYIIDVLWRAGEAKNWGLIIWVVLNMAVIFGLGCIFGTAGMIIAPIAYIISLYIAVSPAGEFLLRHQNGCKKITNKKINERIMPIFNKVYEQAKEKSPNISPKVQLFMCNEDSVNAFATGRKTVCITKGLLEMKDEHIEAILAHEFGHLANRDTDALLIVVVGNLIVTVMMTILATVCKIFGFIIDHSDSGKGLNIGKNFSKIATFILITAFMFIWTKLGALFCMRGNRKQEYAADYYAAELGNAQNLIDAFCEMDEAPAPKGLWATLVSTHPETADRIMKLNEYIDSKNVAISDGE